MNRTELFNFRQFWNCE